LHFALEFILRFFKIYDKIGLGNFINNMFATFCRVVKSGCLNFYRNKWLSSAAIGTISLAVFVMACLLYLNVIVESIVSNLEEKIDISVYFNLDTPEEQILKVKASLSKLKEVKYIEYVSAKDALERFKKRHKDQPVIMEALEATLENGNPLPPTLNIKANLASQYENIANFLNKPEYKKFIDKVNYKENKTVINRLTSVTKTVKKTGVIISLILALIAVLVTFNTIRLTIYSWRDEINIMKLVGATNWFIRGPFLVEGAIYGIISGVLTTLLFYPILLLVSPKISGFLPDIDLLYFYQVNFLSILFFQMIIGIGLGAISSFIAIRRYLKR